MVVVRLSYVRRERTSTRNGIGKPVAEREGWKGPVFGGCPGSEKKSHLFTNHWAAVMTIVAENLSKYCGLTVYTDSIWIGIPVTCSRVSGWGTTSVPLNTTRS